MSAVDLDNMDRNDLCKYAFSVHGVKLPRGAKIEILKTRIRALGDTLENPLQMGEEVRYKKETETCTISKADGSLFTITDQEGEDFIEIKRVELTRVSAAPSRQNITQSTNVENTTLKTEPKSDDKGQPYPQGINEHAYRPKPGALVIGNLPDNGGSNTRETGVTHVLDDTVETN